MAFERFDGRKEAKNQEQGVKQLGIPNFEGLSTEDILEWRQDKDEVWHALPIKDEIHKLPKSYLVNLVYTIVGVPFR